MAKQPFISHTVNGYSRYDVPESKAFTCTPGILYPVRIDFINARDRVTIAQGIDVRSNALAVPSFNPYTVRLHRFWVPIQLYHPELRTNSSKFDMNNLSLNWLPACNSSLSFQTSAGFTNSLLSWLRITHRNINATPVSPTAGTPLPASAPFYAYVNADTYLAYWDIVRNYYSFSQWGVYSFAWPASWSWVKTSSGYSASFNSKQSFFKQDFGNLEFLDAFYESQFYPGSVTTSNDTYNRSNLFIQIINSSLSSLDSISSNGYPVNLLYPQSLSISGTIPQSQFDTKGAAAASDATFFNYFLQAHPMAVIPAAPDRYSRLLPISGSTDVSIANVTTVPQLAIASRLQEYKDLLGAGGSRYSDWLETFFASKIEHVDRPKLLFSASQTVNAQVVMNQAGTNNFQSEQGNGFPLGQQGGSVAFNTQLGRTQSYYFREPGYMIDMLSIRPVYYWAGIQPDYLGYRGSDYFNPVYNDIGYQDVPYHRVVPTAIDDGTAFASEPCFNEFRSSYDEVLGQISSFAGDTGDFPLYAYWVQQRTASYTQPYALLFVDISQVNSPFVSGVEDNFIVNLSYSIRKKNLVNKTFATRLSNR